MIIGEVIQRIQSLYSKGVQSDDSRLSARHIYSKMLSVRSKLLSEKSRKKQKLSQWNFQTLPCVELVEALPYECPCLPEVGCKIMRTVEKLPRPLLNLNRHLIQSVTSVEGSIRYSETSWEEKKYKAGSRYTKKGADYYIRDEYLYITTGDGPKAITITGLFEDPAEAAAFASFCDEEDCEDCADCSPITDREFSIDLDLIEPLVTLAAQELVVFFSQQREDLTNNTVDDSSRIQPRIARNRRNIE